MGIESFFSSIAKTDVIQRDDGITLNLKTKVKTDYLYIDFNSIIYTIATTIETELNYLLYAIIVHEIDDFAKTIAKKLNYDLTEHSLKKYVAFIEKNTTNKQIIDLVEKYLIHVVDDLIDKHSIKKIYIAFDGIPNMGKIIEQKKRRYMGSIISDYKKLLYN